MRLGGDARLLAILDTMPQIVWSARPDGFHDYYNGRWYDFTGVPHGSTDGEGWNEMFHPDDRARAWERWRRSLSTGEPYEIEYRLRRHDGQYHWTLGRAVPVRDARGAIERWFGTCTDIHAVKLLEEQHGLVSQELSHRIKNIFAVISSLVALTSRRDESAQPFAHALQGRIEALAQAHDSVRPGATAPETLHGLLRRLFVPYEHPEAGPDAAASGGAGHRFTIAGADGPVGERAATALALIVHELTTNAVKYGALSRADGRVVVTGEDLAGDRYRLTWQERGGPRVAGPPTRHGFGTVLAHRSAVTQLDGIIEQDWAPSGLTFRLTVERRRLR